MLDFYEVQLILLTSFCLVALILERFVSSRKPVSKSHDFFEDGKTAPAPSVFASLAKKYLIVYTIVMGADWLQGPYVYSLYREQYGFPERLVAVLFVTGFVSAGLTAPLVGVWADQHGRRKLCLAFCITYVITCVLIQIPWLPVLLLGRVFGGISTSILYSAFESWLISSSTSLALPHSDLSTIMGRATLLNGLVATAAGVVSNQLVATTNSFASPFVASGCLLVLAWIVIKGTWTENYGGGGGVSPERDLFQLKRLGQAWRIVREDPILLVLGLTQTCFEGSMYLFVFLWVPSLQEAAAQIHSNPLPLGYIFSSFMVSMMLGSILYSAIVTHSSAAASATDSSRTLHAKMSSLVCAVSALSFAVSIRYRSEEARFWAFCVFESCVGMYYPVQGMLRGTFISNEHRATLSSLFRVPLNVFVVVSMLTGVSSARYTVLAASAVMLGMSSIMTALVIVNRAEEPQTVEVRPT